jgi:hypothetical protein
MGQEKELMVLNHTAYIQAMESFHRRRMFFHELGKKVMAKAKEKDMKPKEMGAMPKNGGGKGGVLLLPIHFPQAFC